MSSFVPVKYRGFWDVPLVFLVRYQGRTFLFDRAFDEELDDYPDVYKVYRMPNLPDEDLPRDWTTLRSSASSLLAEVPITRLHFDTSRRYGADDWAIDSAILDQLIGQELATG